MFHLQTTVPNWLEAVQRLPDGAMVKTIDQGQAFREVKAINPNINTVLRHYYHHDQHFGGTMDDCKQRARVFFDTFIDGTFKQDIAPYCDYVEEWNEYLASSHTGDELQDRINWATAAAIVWRDEYRSQPELSHIRLVLVNAPVGNDISWRFAQIAHLYDCLLSYHSYSWWTTIDGVHIRAANDWDDLSGRWEDMDAEYRARGFIVDWVFTEAGPFEAVETGWLHSVCLDADVDAYEQSMRTWIREVRQTNAYQTGRVKGFALFTTGGGDTWKYFETDHARNELLAEMIAQEWTNVQPVPPPPPPVISPELHQHLWQVSIDNQVLRLNPDAALQKRINSEGYQVVGNEAYTNWLGEDWTVQGAEHLAGEPRHISLAKVGDWDNIMWLPEPATGGGSFVLGSPVDGIPLVVTSPFGVPRDYSDPPDGIQESLHGGVDFGVLDANGVPVPIVAVESGTILWASNLRRSGGESKLGNHVIQQLDNGLIVWYGHMETLTVQSGQSVLQGDMLGLGGNTGYSTGPHLHFTVQSPGHGINDSRYKFSDVLNPGPLLGL